MWHFLYIVAFAVLAVLAVSNMIRNLLTLGQQARQGGVARTYSSGGADVEKSRRPVPHPELLDDDGNVIREPLLVMRSISVKDAREQLDSLFDGSAREVADDFPEGEDERRD